MLERWKKVDNFSDYEVSNLGRVKSLKKGKRRILKPGTDKDGYFFVCLFKNGKRKYYKVHRLVAQVFIPNPKNLPEINHIDEDKQNNCVENLEWCDRQYNIDYSKSKKVGQYDLGGNLIFTWKSAAELYRYSKYDPSYISKCCRGLLSPTAYGYIWKYV